MNTQNRNLGIRLDAPLSARLETFEQRTGVGAATLGRNALIAALDYFDQHGSISFPLRLIEATRNPKTISTGFQLNETPTPYGDDIPVTVTIAKPAGADALNEAIALAERLAKAASSAGPTKATASPAPKESPPPRKRVRSTETGEK